MKQTQKKLMALFAAYVCLSLLMVILCETGVVETGLRAERQQEQYVVLTVMELLTVCLIPTAVRMFHYFKSKGKAIDSPKKLLRWGTLRMSMLGLPMVVNTFFYYLYLAVAFGYMAIILALCMIFVCPTKGRCESEVQP